MKKLLSILLAVVLVFSMGSIDVFASNPPNSILNQTTGVTYDTLSDALNAAVSGNVIYFTSDYVLEGSVTIPSGVTVVVPSSSAHNDTTTGHNAQGSVVNGTAYVTVTVPSGISMIVNGTLLVAGNQQSTQPASGCRTGNYGAIALGGSIVVNGSLYARGRIYGDGTVTALSGSSVYQMLQILDWRGGSAATSAYAYFIFPFNRYKFDNIEAEAQYYYGSKLYAQYYIYAGGTDIFGSANIIGSYGLLRIASSGQSISTTYNSGVLTATVNGNVSTGSISVQITDTLTVYSNLTVLPFGYNMNVCIPSGSKLTINNYVKLLPGCVISNDGTLKVSATGRLFVYGAGGYSTNFTFGGWPNMPSYASLTGSGTFSGKIASSDSSLSNVPFSSYSSTATISEYIQSTDSTQSVTFYVK